MARPRLRLPETEIANAYRAGASINHLAQHHGVDRYVIRRILNEHGATTPDNNVIELRPTPAQANCPPGHIPSTDLQQRAGITYRQLDYWTRTGLIHPAPRRPDQRSGIPRTYPHAEAAVAYLMGRLTDAGLAPRPAHDTARALLEHGTADLAGIPIHLPQEL